MSFLEYRIKTAPSGLRKVFYINWPLVLLLSAVASVGFLMLYSVAGGNMETWAEPQMKRFGVGMVLMFVVAFTPIWFWRNMSVLACVVRTSAKAICTSSSRVAPPLTRFCWR